MCEEGKGRGERVLMGMKQSKCVRKRKERYCMERRKEG